MNIVILEHFFFYTVFLLLIQYKPRLYKKEISSTKAEDYLEY